MSSYKSFKPETPIEKARRLGKIAEAMADVMLERDAAAGNCTIDDLAYAGFTSAEITEYAPEARTTATRRSVREAA